MTDCRKGFTAQRPPLPRTTKPGNCPHRRSQIPTYPASLVPGCRSPRSRSALDGGGSLRLQELFPHARERRTELSLPSTNEELKHYKRLKAKMAGGLEDQDLIGKAFDPLHPNVAALVFLAAVLLFFALMLSALANLSHGVER